MANRLSSLFNQAKQGLTPLTGTAKVLSAGIAAPFQALGSYLTNPTKPSFGQAFRSTPAQQSFNQISNPVPKAQPFVGPKLPAPIATSVDQPQGPVSSTGFSPTQFQTSVSSVQPVNNPGLFGFGDGSQFLGDGTQVNEPFKLDTPTTTPTSTLSESPKSDFDIQSFFLDQQNRLNQSLQPLMDYLGGQDSTVMNAANEANRLQTESDQLELDAREQQRQLGNQGEIPMPVVTAQQAEAARQADYRLATKNIQLQSALRTLQSAQAGQTQKFEAAKFVYNAQRNNLTDTLDIYTKTAPQNIGTQVNDSTGDIYVTTRNPITGQVTTQKAGNIGAQKGYASTTIQQDSEGNFVMFGITPSGDVDVVPLGVQGTAKKADLIKVPNPLTGGELLYNPLTGQTIDPLNGTAGQIGGVPLPGFGGAVNPQTGQPWRTDRNNNPIAAAISTNSSGNEFTRALDKAGIAWTHGDTWGDGSMSTIRVLGNPLEGARAILSNSNAIQNWYVNHTGKGVLPQYGVRTNADFQRLPVDTQNKIIAEIYKSEGGSGELLGSNPEAERQTLNMIVRRLPAGQQDGAFSAISAFKNAADLFGVLDQGVKTGPISGRVGKLAQKFGNSDPRFDEFNSTATIFTANFIKAISGVQVSDNERKFLMNALPSPNKQEQVNRANITALLNFLRNKYESQLGINFDQFPNEIPQGAKLADSTNILDQLLLANTR